MSWLSVLRARMRKPWWLLPVALVWLGLTGCDGVEGMGASGEGSHQVDPVELPATRPPPLLLISLDGFHPHYLRRGRTPNLDRLRAEGAMADGLVQVFPTKTFTTHFSLVTGQRVDGHGVAANSMWDPNRQVRFSLRDRDAVMDPAWYDAEPIWVTAERQGLTAATFFWPGSEAPIGGSHPSYWKPYDVSVPHRQRIAQVLTWLDKPADRRPDLITLYLSHVDSVGHRHGPESDAVIEAVEAVDRDLGTLFDGLAERQLLGRMHVLVVSDHGMAAIDPDRYILLDRKLSMGGIRVSDWGPAAHIWAEGMTVDAIMEQLQDAHPRLRVWRREDTPAHYGFSRHPRVADVIAEADMGWMISTRRHHLAQRARPLRGMHGWDPLHRSMHGIWLAHGPAFQQGAELGPVEGVHLYALLARLLAIEPAQHEGELAAWSPVLTSAPDSGASPLGPVPVLYGARYPGPANHTAAELAEEALEDVRLQGRLRVDCPGDEMQECRWTLVEGNRSVQLMLDGLVADWPGDSPGQVRLQGDWQPPVLQVHSLLMLEPRRLLSRRPD